MRTAPDLIYRLQRIVRHLVATGSLLAAAMLAPFGARAQAPLPAASGGNVPAAIIRALDASFGGPHAGLRAVHAKGLLCEGTFDPSPDAAVLSRAAHLQGSAVPVLVRFSNRAAIPGLPDGHPRSSPRGMAVKFLLPDGEDTDVLAHSYNGFPAATPAEFLAYLQAMSGEAAMQAYAAEHGAARRFLDDPKPTPSSYGTEVYFGVNAFRFTNATGQSRYGRYRIVPSAGSLHLSAEEAAGRAPDFLGAEMAERLRRGPVEFRLLVQLASEDDAIEDGSVTWPESRPTVELGTLTLRTLLPADDARQAGLFFMPTNLVGGIAPSADPMLLARTQAYRISVDRRAVDR